MMRIGSTVGSAIALMSAVVPGMASAHVPSAPTFFGAEAVADVELRTMRGGYVRDGLTRPMIDAQARSDFRLSADVGTITFDNWFVDVGAAMIINARLTALQ